MACRTMQNRARKASGGGDMLICGGAATAQYAENFETRNSLTYTSFPHCTIASSLSCSSTSASMFLFGGSE